MPHSYHQKNDADLRKLLKSHEAELAVFRFGGAGGKVTNVKLGRNRRRDIARIKTIFRQRSQAKSID